ncbi:hypothetical protein OE88DRAFT_1329127 [Heliocybe sulcata]|uniref:Uncharacterized protein n=1 Tax=Heliocybe sulcata TaxID=5364 RepID=A0A5C3N863_9AGAM|nr:hypothetical protein OE88DRAFT_1329127 [Heliocybe sulcata]
MPAIVPGVWRTKRQGDSKRSGCGGLMLPDAVAAQLTSTASTPCTPVFQVRRSIRNPPSPSGSRFSLRLGLCAPWMYPYSYRPSISTYRTDEGEQVVSQLPPMTTQEDLLQERGLYDSYLYRDGYQGAPYDDPAINQRRGALARVLQRNPAGSEETETIIHEVTIAGAPITMLIPMH